MSYENFSKGSEWRKWDLHIHSNASDGKMTPEEIIDKAVEKELSVIALTDHHTAKNIDQIKQYGTSKGIKVISGIEFKTEYGESSVHMIGLFPDIFNNILLDSKTLHERVLCKLNLSELEIIQKGKEQDISLDDEKAFKHGMFLKLVDFRQAADLIHSFGGLVSVHAGSKVKSIEAMKHIGLAANNVSQLHDCLGPLKAELLGNYVDICEISKDNDSNSFYLEQFGLPSIVASDAHVKEDIGSKYVWIKADTTFEGLKQILCEQLGRVKILGDKPEEKKHYNVIEKVKFIDKSGKIFTDKEIGFSSGLNAIIGGKSSGKSLLLHMLAKAIGNKTDSKDYSGITNGVELEIYYADDLTTKRTDKDGRIIEYLPQLHIESIVRDESSAKNYFNNFVKDLVRQDTEVNQQYVNHESKITELKNNLDSSIKNWLDLDKKLSYEKDLLKPMGEKQSIQKEIERITANISSLTVQAGLTTDELTIYQALSSKNAELTINIKNAQDTLQELEKLQNYIVNSLSKNLLETITFNTKNNEIQQHVISLKETIADSIGKEISTFASKLDALIIKEKNSIDALTLELDSNTQILKPILMKSNMQDAIEKLKKDLEMEKSKLDLISNKESEIAELLRQRSAVNFLQDYSAIFESYNLLAGSSNATISDKWEHTKTQITLTGSVVFDSEKFIDSISQSVNVKSYLENQFKDAGFKESNYQFSNNHCFNISKILEKITKDSERFSNFKSGGNLEVLLRAIFSDYYYINFDIQKGNDNLKNMSEGKKGIVILQLYLSLSKSDCPILIDQPEDNLDNRTVYTELNDYIKSCKIRRQIIMVSHNANLVVNTDAENVIVANQMGEDGKENKQFRFEYVNGALENTFEEKEEKGILYQKGIREHVCEILEGGTDAFKKREKKYRFD